MNYTSNNKPLKSNSWYFYVFNFVAIMAYMLFTLDSLRVLDRMTPFVSYHRQSTSTKAKSPGYPGGRRIPAMPRFRTSDRLKK